MKLAKVIPAEDWNAVFRDDNLAKAKRGRNKARRHKKLRLSRVIALKRALPRGPMGAQGPVGCDGPVGIPGWPERSEWDAFLATMKKFERKDTEGYASNT